MPKNMSAEQWNQLLLAQRPAIETPAGQQHRCERDQRDERDEKGPILHGVELRGPIGEGTQITSGSC